MNFPEASSASSIVPKITVENSSQVNSHRVIYPFCTTCSKLSEKENTWIRFGRQFSKKIPNTKLKKIKYSTHLYSLEWKHMWGMSKKHLIPLFSNFFIGMKIQAGTTFSFWKILVYFLYVMIYHTSVLLIVEQKN